MGSHGSVDHGNPPEAPERRRLQPNSQAETFANLLAQVDRATVPPKRHSSTEARGAAPGTRFLRWFMLLLLAQTVLTVALVKLLP